MSDFQAALLFAMFIIFAIIAVIGIHEMAKHRNGNDDKPG